MKSEVMRMGKRGTVVIPSSLRKQFQLQEGDFMVAEDCDTGILIRLAVVLPVEHYSLERQAEFLLSNAIDETDYKAAQEAVRQMGLNPDTILHIKPSDAPALPES